MEGTRGLVKSIKRASHPLTIDALIRPRPRLPRHVRPRGPLWPPTHRRRSLAPQGHRRKNDLRFVGLLCALRRPLNVRDPDKKPPLSYATCIHTHPTEHIHAHAHTCHISRTPPQRRRLCQRDTRLDHRMLRRSVQTYLILQSLFPGKLMILTLPAFPFPVDRLSFPPPSFLEFIHLISSEANEICEQDSKKTIAPEHIIGALKVCLHFFLALPLGANWHSDY